MKLLNRVLRRRRRGPGTVSYEKLYENHAVASRHDGYAIGRGDYSLIGQTELALLTAEGLRPSHTLVDFGCGVGRLAEHAIPYLSGGHYVGIDISPTFIAECERRFPGHEVAGCRVAWVKPTSDRFPFGNATVDVICAFSVFTHMEHEDAYRYLCDGRRIVRSGGLFVFSCLPLQTAAGPEVFRVEAGMNPADRWSRVRNVVTSADLMSGIAELAGWRVRRWRAGDQANIELPDGRLVGLGQSSCVLEAA